MGKRYYAGRIFPDDAERMPVQSLEDCECRSATFNEQVDGHGLVFYYLCGCFGHCFSESDGIGLASCGCLRDANGHRRFFFEAVLHLFNPFLWRTAMKYIVGHQHFLHVLPECAALRASL